MEDTACTYIIILVKEMVLLGAEFRGVGSLKCMFVSV